MGSTPSFGTLDDDYIIIHDPPLVFYPLLSHPVVSTDDASQTPAVERGRTVILGKVGMAPRPIIGRLAALLAGMAFGIAIGLSIAWVLWPLQYTSADPSDLRTAFKDDYIRMIGAIYEMNGDLVGAKRRLAILSASAPAQTVNDFLARDKGLTLDQKTLIAVYHLAQALYGAAGPRPAGGTLDSSSIALLATSQQAVPIFQLVERTPLSCVDEPDQARLRFVVRDAKGTELPNIPIEIRWSTGDETVYTGLKPERGMGYADYDAGPGTFTATILNATGEAAAQLVIGDVALNCQTDRNAPPRGWKLVFQQK